MKGGIMTDLEIVELALRHTRQNLDGKGLEWALKEIADAIAHLEKSNRV
jgi:hypothetical protein